MCLVCCSAAACSDIPQLESLSHMFMHCPVVQPAVVWLQDLWARLVPGSRLPLDVRVLVAGDLPHCVGPGRGGCWGGAVGPSETALLSCGLALAVLQGGQWSGFHSRCSGCADGCLDCEGCAA